MWVILTACPNVSVVVKKRASNTSFCILVSQTEAKERIASMNMQVVGWYHSHPTFEPNPSVRDIETQECLQVDPVPCFISFYTQKNS